MTAIDDAKAKLKALGHEVGEVEKISNNANKAVKGTAFGMDAAMTAAASATAAGIKPGKELTRYLQLMGDAAAVAGVDMNEMGSIFNKVAANGKVSTEEMNQLADRGIPIWQLLAKETGMSMEELRP
jgi:tape measure domain-containing protein